MVEVAHTFIDGRDLEEKGEEAAVSQGSKPRDTWEEDEMSDSRSNDHGPFSEVEAPTVESSRLLHFLTTFCDLEVELSRVGGLIALVILKREDGRRVILMQRVFRGGVYSLEDPTDDEVAMARAKADLAELWNSPRGVYMTELVY